MTEEYELIICKCCGQAKKRYNAGRRPNLKDTRYVDENGKEWSGRRCPRCQVQSVLARKRANSQLKRALKELDNGNK